MRQIVGFDLNGWHDHAARDWSLDDSDQDGDSGLLPLSDGDRTVRYLDGGTAAVVVTFGADGYVGGPQAILSPIGRGGGWGEVGREEKRRPISDLLRSLLARNVSSEFRSQFRAAVDALSVSAQDVLLTVPDREEFDDERQQMLLDSLVGPRRKSYRLLWRPVAVVLSALEARLLPSIRDGLKIVCLHHTDDGIERQSLVLRELSDRPCTFAPERAACGAVVGRSVGLARLLEEAERQVMTHNSHLSVQRHDSSRLAARMMLDGIPVGTVEILRLDNGRWVRTRAPAPGVPECLTGGLDIGSIDAEVVLLTTPLADPWRREFVACVGAAAGAIPLIVMPAEAAAHGALVAGRRIERDVPHYLDRLEQISLIALRDGDPVLVDLIPAEATVPANREYISQPITNLSWPGGVTNVDFYIQKAGEFRKWRTPNKAPPIERQPVEIRLRQMPAQGQAKLSATSIAWETLRANPVFLDWSNLPIDSRSFEEIAAELKPRPIVPKRITVQTHPDIWYGSDKITPISAMLDRFSIANDASLGELGKALKRTYRFEVSEYDSYQQDAWAFHAVDYDGNVPISVDARVVTKFDDVLNQVSEHIRRFCAKAEVIQSNRLLMLATWAFGRCPKALQDEMLNALRAHLGGRAHPLLASRQSDRVLLHGLGRTIIDVGRLATLIDLVGPNLERPYFLPALSSALSRPIATPQILTDDRVRLIAAKTVSVLDNLKREWKFAVNLKYALLVVGGLLRVREHDSFALMTARSREAVAILDQLNGIRDILARNARRFTKSEKKMAIIASFIAMLEGRGGSVGVLEDVESLDEIDD